MSAVLILQAKVRRSHESKTGVVGRITQNNHHIIASLLTSLQSLTNQLRAHAQPLKLRQYGHGSQYDTVERGGSIVDGHAGEEDMNDHAVVAYGDEGDEGFLALGNQPDELGFG